MLLSAIVHITTTAVQKNEQQTDYAMYEESHVTETDEYIKTY
jgi:hypothetical protein